MSPSFNEEYRFGSAAFAEEWGIRSAGLFKNTGPQIGYKENKPIYLEGDAPMITIGGAGSGKMRDQLAYTLCRSKGQRLMVLDPRGEIYKVSSPSHAKNGEYVYSWNPAKLLDIPSHRCNPLDILKLNSPNFHGDCRFIVEALITLSGGSEGKYFELRARDYLDAFLKYLVERFGAVSFPMLSALINIIESDLATWADHLEWMLKSRFEDVRRTAGEILTKQQDSPKEFGSIMGEVYAYLSFLNDPVLLDSLNGEDFSLEDLCNGGRATKIFLNVPAEYLGIWSPILRLFFTVAMLYKSRAPSAQRILLIVDEAGQLGRFEALLRAFTFGSGAGIRAWAIFQDAGQIIRNFDAQALQSFLGSAQLRQFFGVRDYQTAQLISDMLGTETLSYDNTLQQEQARRKKLEAVQKFISGGDPFSSAFDVSHFDQSSKIKTKQARKLKTPDEILSLPEDQQILFISGKNLKPILANKYPYYTRSEMAGLYLPNPYHPPSDKVQIAGRFGNRWIRVITEAVPYQFSTFPQYSSGYWSYVEGYKP